MIRNAIALLLAGALVAPASTSAAAQDPPAAVPPGIGIGLAEAPVERRGDPRAHVYIIDHVEPGAEFTRRFRVSNGTDDEVVLDLYAAPAVIESGGFVVLERGASNEATTWMSTTPDRLRLPPHTIEEATVTFRVAPDATTGEHYAAVVAELPAPSSGSGVAVASRVGLRVYLSVGAGGEPPTDFRIHSLTAGRDPAGAPVVRAQVENTGERAIDLRGELALLDGPGGLQAGPFPAELGTTLGPGQAAPMTVVLDPEIPSGPWRARMLARSGTLERAVEATITFPDAAGESADPVAATEVPLHRDRGFLVPVAGALVLLALLALLVVWWFLRRRRDEDEDEDRRRRPAASRPKVRAGR